METKNLIFKSNKAAFDYSLEFPLTIGLFFNVALVTENLGNGNYELLININGEKNVKIADDGESNINYKVGDFVTVGHTFDEVIKRDKHFGSLLLKIKQAYDDYVQSKDGASVDAS